MAETGASRSTHAMIHARYAVITVFLVAYLLAAAKAVALEPDELWPGMKPDEVASVYTSHRSCTNFIFLEEPDFMTWDARLFDRDARIEARFEQTRAQSIIIRIFLESGDDGSDALRQLADDQTRAYGPPVLDAQGTMRWYRSTLVIVLGMETVLGSREVRLVKNVRAVGD